jgi:hypothetical protein
MKPMGRKKLRFPSKTDHHPPKGFINWWEDIVAPSKGRERQKARREIEREINDGI